MTKIPKTPLTRQHFEYFAWCISLMIDDYLFKFTRDWMAETLIHTNAVFDRERFVKRCDELRAEYRLEDSQ